MDINNIKKFIQLMKGNQLTEFELEEEGFRISIKRRDGSEPQVMLSAGHAPMMMAPPVASHSAAAAVSEAKAQAEKSNLIEIKSPIVGTFYRATSPDAEPFVTVGQPVEPESIVCIIEAMKVMNEIKAEIRGVVKKILVDNATAVQYGQTLLLIEPA